MTKRTTNLLGIIIAILAGTFFYLKLCSSCGVPFLEDPVKEVMVVPTTPQPASYSLAFSFGDYRQNTNNNYNCNESSPAILMPISQKVLDGTASLITSLLEKKGNITGYFEDNETINAVFPNLVLAMANRLKHHMVENVNLGPLAFVIATSTKHPNNNTTLLSLNR